MRILAMIMAVGAVGASLVRLQRVRGAVSFDLPALTRALGRSADAVRLAELREDMQQEGNTWECELVGVALETHHPDQRAALVNEVLGDVGSAILWGNRIPLVAARLSALGPLSLLFFALATQSASLADIVPVIAWGGAGVVGALTVGREADRVAAELREGVDAWVTRVLDAAANVGHSR